MKKNPRIFTDSRGDFEWLTKKSLKKLEKPMEKLPIAKKLIHPVKYFEARIRINGERYSIYGASHAECRLEIDKLRFNGPTKKKQALTLSECLLNG